MQPVYTFDIMRIGFVTSDRYATARRVCIIRQSRHVPGATRYMLTYCELLAHRLIDAWYRQRRYITEYNVY